MPKTERKTRARLQNDDMMTDASKHHMIVRQYLVTSSSDDIRSLYDGGLKHICQAASALVEPLLNDSNDSSPLPYDAQAVWFHQIWCGNVKKQITDAVCDNRNAVKFVMDTVSKSSLERSCKQVTSKVRVQERGQSAEAIEALKSVTSWLSHPGFVIACSHEGHVEKIIATDRGKFLGIYRRHQMQVNYALQPEKLFQYEFVYHPQSRTWKTKSNNTIGFNMDMTQKKFEQFSALC
jgi:hypothetical protein